MIGQLPKTLAVQGRQYEIRSDYRNILTIIQAYNDKELNDNEKALVCLTRMYVDVESIPKTGEAYQEALKRATEFIECKLSEDKPGPRLVNWEKDEQLIFPSINKVAGTEIRLLPYMHWWTFLGYFQEAGKDDLWGMVLAIRQKKKRGKKLEKFEKEFYASNRELCRIDDAETGATPENMLSEIYKSLLEEQKEGGGANG